MGDTSLQPRPLVEMGESVTSSGPQGPPNQYDNSGPSVSSGEGFQAPPQVPKPAHCQVPWVSGLGFAWSLGPSSRGLQITLQMVHAP